MYPLVICYIAIEHDHKNSGFSHEKLWFSIAMLVYQRVDQITTNILWMGQRNPNHQLIDVENGGWSHDFWCVQPSQIGGAGFRWPIHSITMKNPEIMKFLPAGDPSKSSIFWGGNFHDFPWENILFWGDRPGKSWRIHQKSCFSSFFWWLSIGKCQKPGRNIARFCDRLMAAACCEHV